jgi:hypothetical protein
MAEGFGHGKMNNEGYNNIYDYNGQEINVLLMGTSHIEGVNVNQKWTTASVLNNLLKTKTVYNIGFSTHDLLRNIKNLENAVNYYKPHDYVVLETSEMVFTVEGIENVIYSRMEKLPSFDNGILSLFQKLPYLRLVYRQMRFITGFHVTDMMKFFQKKILPLENKPIDNREIENKLDVLMQRAAKICSDRDVGLMIVYHPHLIVQENGLVSVETPEHTAILKNICEINNIRFINMADIFINEYYSNHTLPHGFLNTGIGVGHLNRNGHRLIANELYRQIKK